MTNRFGTTALLATVAIIAAGCEDDSAGPDGPSNGVVAQVQYTSARPELYLQDIRGDQKRRVSFTGAVDPIPGNSPLVPPVRDENLLALGPLSWSPDGGKLALVAALANDQSEVVVVDANGSNARVASINSQIIIGDVTWSDDTRQIAYAMSTLPFALGLEVFVTDLEQNRVRKLTTNSGFGISGSTIRFSADGREVFYSRSIASIPGQNAGELLAVDLSSLSVRTVATNLSGDVTGIARDARWVLLLQNNSQLPDGSYDRKLVRRDLASGRETVLVASGRIQYAKVLPGEAQVLVVTDVSTNPGAPDYRYATVGVAGGTMSNIGGIGATTTNVAVHPAARL
jgi:hypothetical protein